LAEPEPAVAIPTVRPIRRRPWADRILIHVPLLAPLVVLVAVIVFFTVASGGDFIQPNNIRNIASELSLLAVMATGMTLVLLLGEIDLSVASIAVMTGMIATIFYSGQSIELEVVGSVTVHVAQWLAILLALVAAALFGFGNGLITAYLRLPSFIVTLASLEIAGGITFYLAKGKIIFDIPPLSKALGADSTGPVPTIFLCVLAVLAGAYLVLKYTRFGRYIYMTGSNRDAANLSGIATKQVIVGVFVISSVLAGIAGILNTGELGSAQPTGSTELVLPVIAAVVLGGTSLFGGVGGILQTAIGLVLFACLENGLDEISLNVYLKPFFSGVFLLFAIVINVYALELASRANRRGAGRTVPDS